MPEIKVTFFDFPEVRKFLEGNKMALVEAIAPFLGYSPEIVGFYPHPIAERDIALTYHMYQLNFKADSGINAVGITDERTEEARQAIIAQCPEIAQFEFDLWIIGHGNNGYAAYKPS